MATGLIQIYTGNGKGKTTAALGLILRARGAGKHAVVLFFDKGGNHYAERKMFDAIGVDWFACGLDRIDPQTGRFRFGITPEDITEAEQGMIRARKYITLRYYDLVVLDEINTAVALGMVQESAIELLLDAKPPDTELVLTGRIDVVGGRIPMPKYFERADLITEMRLKKHYFYKGIPAREGIDF